MGQNYRQQSINLLPTLLKLAVSDVIPFAFCQLGLQRRVKHKSEQTQVPSCHLVVDSIKLSTS